MCWKPGRRKKRMREKGKWKEKGRKEGKQQGGRKRRKNKWKEGKGKNRTKGRQRMSEEKAGQASFLYNSFLLLILPSRQPGELLC
jgi:hypothetical protein